MYAPCVCCNREIEITLGVKYCRHCGIGLGDYDKKADYIDKENELVETMSSIRWNLFSAVALPLAYFLVYYADAVAVQYNFQWFWPSLLTILTLTICIHNVAKKYKHLKDLEIFLHNAKDTAFVSE